jgi:hypothetical protein
MVPMMPAAPAEFVTQTVVVEITPVGNVYVVTGTDDATEIGKLAVDDVAAGDDEAPEAAGDEVAPEDAAFDEAPEPEEYEAADDEAVEEQTLYSVRVYDTQLLTRISMRSAYTVTIVG